MLFLLKVNSDDCIERGIKYYCPDFSIYRNVLIAALSLFCVDVEYTKGIYPYESINDDVLYAA